MKQPSRRTKIGISCCLVATISFLHRAQYILNSAQSASSNDASIDTLERVDDTSWSARPSHAQVAATALLDTKETWDASADSPLQSQHWHTLSKLEKIADVQLEMDEDWTRDDGYDGMHWDELEDDVRVAAEKLGYSQDVWDNDKPIELATKRWIDLTSEQRTAAKLIGYSQQKWNGLARKSRQSASTGQLNVSVPVLKGQNESLSATANVAPTQPKQKSVTPLITRPKDGPPLLDLPPNQTLCKLNNYEVVCTNMTRNTSVTSYPLFAEYYIDGDGTRVPKQTNPIHRPISTNWFRPNVTKFCGNFTDQPCANLGDELGPMLLLKLSGVEYIENRYDGMDVVIIGSVLNFIVKKYNDTVRRVGTYFNITVWGTGTKWKTKGVCFDFRAVRGPRTRDKFLKQGCNVPEVYGDPALLFPYIYEPKKLGLPMADLCLVPHLGDLSEDFPWWIEVNGTSLIPRFTHFDHRTNNQTIRVIDIRTPDAAAFIDTLMTCKLVASASLHGMILAEAYNLTWSWIRLRDKYEDPFKYNDFFESVGINKSDVRPLKVRAKDPVDKIIEHTMIPKMRGSSLFNPMKLLDACPFCSPAIVKDIKAVIEGK